MTPKLLREANADREPTGGNYGVFRSKAVPTAAVAAAFFQRELEYSRPITADEVTLEWWDGDGGRDEWGKPWVTRGGRVWTFNRYKYLYEERKP